MRNVPKHLREMLTYNGVTISHQGYTTLLNLKEGLSACVQNYCLTEGICLLGCATFCFIHKVAHHKLRSGLLGKPFP